MFFSSEMLSKRGPLAKVWLAAHVERKVSKAQTLQTSIPSTVTVILEPASTMASAPPLALRLSGQLLLGIARIYSKQAKYLLEDCSEASDKIRAAFRSDTLQSMTDDQIGDDHLYLQIPSNPLGRDGINLRSAANRNLFDLELEFGEGFGYGFGDGWDDANQSNTVGGILPIIGNTSRSRIDADIGDITLDDHQSFIARGRVEEHGLDDLVQDGLMGEGDGFDLGLDIEGDGFIEPDGFESEARQARRRRQAHDPSGLAEEAGDETMEMEVGRDAPGTAGRLSARDSLLPDQIGDLSVDKSYDMTSRMEDTSFALEGDQPAFEHEGNIDLGLDQVLHEVTMNEGQEGVGAGEGQATPRATTPVPNSILDQVDVTPRTSHHLAPHLTSPAAGLTDDQQPPKKKKRHQLIDRVTELASADHLSSSFGGGSSHSGPTHPPRFLPKDRYQLQHYRLMLDPSRHEFLPKLKVVDGERWLMAAPAGLCKELQELFKFPAKAGTIARGTKRLRADEQEPEELESEHGRRAASVGLDGGDFSRIDVGDETFGFMGNEADDPMGMFGADDGFQLELPDKSLVEGDSSIPNLTVPLTEDLRFGEEELRAPSLPPIPPKQDIRRQRAEGEYSKLDVFDDLSDNQSQSQATFELAEPTGTASRSKWSKNTVKALEVLKTELAEEPQVLKFKEVSEKATRKASAAFFFELLVLGTRDCLKLKQDQPFGEIVVESQDRLWEVVQQQTI